MSVPFKYRQHFRDLYRAVGNGKTLSDTDLAYIVQRLPAAARSVVTAAGIVERYTAMCPLDEGQLLTLMGEVQKESAVPFDDLAWGFVEGAARFNFFGDDESSPPDSVSCDTKELRSTLDPKIRPVRIDVSHLFASHTTGGERITLAELMQVFRVIYPTNQTNFFELYNFARASKKVAKSQSLARSSSFVVPSEAPAPAGAASAMTAEGAASPATAAAASTTAIAASAATSSPPPQDDASTALGAVGTNNSFSQLRGRFGSPAASRNLTKGDELTAASPESNDLLRDDPASPIQSSPAPPPPPPDDEDDGSPQAPDLRTASPPPQPEPDNPFAAFLMEREREAAQVLPTVVVTPPAAATAVSTVPTPATQEAPRHQKQSPPMAAVENPPAASVAPASVTATTSATVNFIQEPPPLPPQVRAAMERTLPSSQPVIGGHSKKVTQQQPAAYGSEAAQQPPSTGISGTLGSLSVKHIQMLPPEVIDFINQLDEQRSQLQTQLQRELDELTQSQDTLRLMKDRLAYLEDLQASPSYQPLEGARNDLIHKMEQWIFATRAAKEASRQEIARWRQSQQVDQMARTVLYRDPMAGAMPPASTAFSVSQVHDDSVVAMQLSTAESTTRLASFLDGISRSEQHIKQQETAMEKLRRLEKREKKLLTAMAEVEASHYSSSPPRASEAATVQPSMEALMTAAKPSFVDVEPTRQEQPQALNGGPSNRVFRMPGTSMTGHANVASQQRGRADVPSSLFFRPAPAVAASTQQRTFGVSPSNPYTAKNIAERHTTAMEASMHTTRRLEEHLGGGSHTRRL